MYERDPPHIVRLGRGQTLVDSVEHMLQERDAILDELHFNLTREHLIMKQTTNLKRRDEVFKEGDFVYLKLQLYRQ